MDNEKSEVKLIMIAAAGENDALGKDNALLWHLPDDFKRFKKLTTGHKIIMGRKTFESFPKPLPNRWNIIITRDPHYSLPITDGIVVHSMESALTLVAEDAQAYIIGGGEIYAMGMEVSHHIELTRVHGTFEADTFFPSIDSNEWDLVQEEYHPKDERHDYAFSYLRYDKKDTP